MWEYRNTTLAKMIESGAITPASAKIAPLVVILDCWSVNTSKEFQECVAKTFPLIRVRYIPAGMTGMGQINDT